MDNGLNIRRKLYWLLLFIIGVSFAISLILGLFLFVINDQNGEQIVRTVLGKSAPQSDIQSNRTIIFLPVITRDWKQQPGPQ